jgi:hypothetical protein
MITRSLGLDWIEVVTANRPVFTSATRRIDHG